MVQLMVFRYEQTHAIRLLKFIFLDLCAMTLFVTFLVLAILRIRRGDRDGHTRYMAGTVLFALAVLLLLEWRRHRIRLPFAMALGFFMAMHVFLTPVANSQLFTKFAEWFAQI